MNNVKKKFVMKFIFLFILSFSIKAQQSKQVFHFVVADKVIVDSLTGSYYGKSFEFNYTRIFYSDSCFKEVDLFAKGDNKTFKIKNGTWYIKDGKKWNLFYSPYKIVIPKIKLSGLWYCLEPHEQQLLNGIPCTVYKLVPVGFSVSDSPKYWFNPLYGIIQIKGGEVELIRKDLLCKSR